jgi:hypothetical protein
MGSVNVLDDVQAEVALRVELLSDTAHGVERME